MKIHFDKTILKYVLGITIFFFYGIMAVHAQTPSISTSNPSPLVGQTVTYTISLNGAQVAQESWTLPRAGGQIMSSNASQAQVKWNSSGALSIQFNYETLNGNDLSVRKSVPVGTTPPAEPTIAEVDYENCEVILRRANPTDGSTWYWQGTNSTGESLANGLSIYKPTADGTYYLRAYRNGQWSTAASETVVMPGTPSPPLALVTQQPTCTSGTGEIIIPDDVALPPVNGVQAKYSFDDGQTWQSSKGASNLSSGTYLVRSQSGAGCISDATTVSIDPQPITPVKPTLTRLSQPNCTNGNGTFRINNYNGNYTYVISPSTGVSRNNNTVTAPGNKTYTVTASLGDCTSSTSNGLNLAAQPSTPSKPTLSLVSQPGCGEDEGAFTIDNYNSNYTYEITPSAGVNLNNDLVTAPAGQTYTVTAIQGSCSSPASNGMTINAGLTQPAAPSADAVERCGPGSVVLVATGFPSGQYRWYGPSGNLISNTSNQLPRTLSSDRTYQVSSVVNGCESERTDVNIIIHPEPGNPTGQTQYSVCGGETVSLSLTAGSNASTVRWYEMDNTSGAFFTGDITRGAGTYYATSYNTTSGCESDMVPVTVGAVAQKIWYPDSDNDSYRDPGGQGVSDCSDRGDFWTDSEIDDLCPDVYNVNNDAPDRWFVDEDGDDLRDSATDVGEQDCVIRGAGWTTNAVVDNCPGLNDPANPQPRIWYADTDENGQGDGLGDPDTPSELLCVAPAGYVGNSDDLCPNFVSPTNDCFFTPTDCNPSGTAPSGQWSANNYVYSRTYQEKVDNIPGAKFLNDDRYLQSITYFDGLGRPIQQNAIRQSPNGNDIITHMDYDSQGRMTKDWLPVPESQQPQGRLKTGDLETLIKGYYNTNYGDDFTGLTLANQNPYSEKTLEASPLNRVMAQAAPGKDWKRGSGHEIEFDYEVNTAADGVKRFDVTLTPSGKTYTPALQPQPDYVPGELRKTITKDENHNGTNKNHTTEEFTDKQGRVVLKRAYADVTQPGGAVSVAEAHDTYYVYDDFGNLTYVLPPKMNGGTAYLNELGYQYVYDYRNRLVEKKIPGKEWEYIVYNNLDQPILTQDANQRAKSPDEWLFTKYDNQGRVAYTGKATAPDGTTRTTVQNEVAGLTGLLWVNQSTTDRNTEFTEDVAIFYDNGAYPDDNSTVSLSEVLTINYYDTYVDHGTNVPTTITPLGESVAIDATANNVNGLATGSRVKVLDQSPAKWITTVSYYDDKGRPIYTHSTNDFLETVDIMETELDFIGKPLKNRSTHTRSLSGAEATIVTIDNFAYDHTGRLLAQTQCIGDETLGTSCGGATGGSTVQPIETLTGTVNETVVASEYIEAVPTTILDPGTDLIISTTTIDSGGDQELIVYNDYDEIGQLRYKKVGGNPNFTNLEDSPGLQRIDYTYNVRGWLKTINEDQHDDNDLFDFTLRYNDPQGGGQALYNGNISQTLWSSMSVNTPNVSGALNDVSHTYTYSYDALNRIIGAKDNTGRYNLGAYDGSGDLTQPLTYDKNGNIETLYRTGHTNANYTTFGAMDQLTYAYDNGNQLQSVGDGAAGTGFTDNNAGGLDYDYDANGNMTMDLNKGIQTQGIAYNHLNLPTNVVVNGIENGTIDYIYDATGVKLRKNVLKNGNTTTTDYAGNYVYKTPAGDNASLEFFNTPEGYLEPKNSNNYSQGFNYVYQYKDHLGNVRLSYSDANNDGDIDATNDPMTTEILEENNYYPFGLKHKGYNYNQNGRDHKYGFGNKEEQDDDVAGTRLDWLDFGARNYDASIGRWYSTDGKAELYFANSPYVYALNTPVNAIDPDGNLVIFINGLGGGGKNYWRSDIYKPKYKGRRSVGREFVRRIEFDKLVLNHFGEKESQARYFDGSPGSIVENLGAGHRYTKGYEEGLAMAPELIESLARDPQGNITETIKIITHSMGGVYGKGFVKALKKYIRTHKDPRVRKAIISLVADFDPFQAGSVVGKADSDIFTQQFIHSGASDIVGAGGLANENEEGADDTKENEDKSSHFIETFVDNIQDLQEGIYRWDKDNQEWTCTNCKND